ncbi:MAG: hypothetical protein LBV02_08465 [Bacteroidales bacterium]|jgi:hypothetical protein|nr:hypothetical protein [Bacteroidales bacterium]
MPIIDFEKDKIVDGYKVPDGYFNYLEETVLQRISVEKRRRKRNRITLWISSTAACVIVLLGLVFFLPNEEPPVALHNANETETHSTETMDAFFSEIEKIEEKLLAYNAISEQQTRQIAQDLEKQVTAIEEMMDAGKMRDEDYQMLDYYVEETMYDIYY